MKVKLLITIAIVLLSQNLFAQNLEDFTGIYAVKQRCWEFNNNWQETTEYEVEINYATNDSTNLEMKLVLLKPYTLGFNAKSDSMIWVYTHLFLNENNLTQFVDGNGVIYKDSIDLNMNTANDSIIFKCDCNGNKVRDVPLSVTENNLLNKTISLYPNPVKEELKVLWPILSGKSYNNFKIYDLSGQSVLENKSQLFERIDVRGLQAGVYIIQFLKDEVSIASGRFVKME